jgi:hypothetical protein
MSEEEKEEFEDIKGVKKSVISLFLKFQTKIFFFSV